MKLAVRLTADAPSGRPGGSAAADAEEQVALVGRVEAAGPEAPPPVGGGGARGGHERQEDGQEQQSGGHVATITRNGSWEHQQRGSRLLAGRPGRRASAGDQQADPAGAVLVLDRLCDADVGQPAAALEAPVELPGALLLDAVGGPDGHERAAGQEADEHADDDRCGHRLPLRMLRSSTVTRSTASDPMTARRSVAKRDTAVARILGDRHRPRPRLSTPPLCYPPTLQRAPAHDLRSARIPYQPGGSGRTRTSLAEDRPVAARHEGPSGRRRRRAPQRCAMRGVRQAGGPRTVRFPLGGEAVPSASNVAEVEAIKGRLEGSVAALLTEYRGLDVKELFELRASLRGSSTEYRVLKNTLTTIAAREAGYQDLLPLLQGPTAVAFVHGDPVQAAKDLAEFARTPPALVAKGGVLDGRVLAADEVRRLATLESREVLLARLAGLFQAPLQQTASLLAAPLRQVATMTSALRDQTNQQSEQ